MSFIYEIDKLRDIIEQFYKLTGIPVTVYDSDFKNVIGISGALTSYCSVLWNNEMTGNKCRESDIDACHQCAAKKTSFTYTCHAGLTETIIPISFNDIIFGYLIFGQYADSEKKYSSLKTVIDASQKYNLSVDEMITNYNKLVKLSHLQIEGATKLLEICTLKIYMDQLIRSESSNLFIDLVDYIHNNITENLTVNSICNHFFISKNRLYKIFHENSKTTFTSYVINLRIEISKKLLKDSEKTIEEIAEEVGFKDYNYFIQTFRKKEKMTPYRYRKALSGE